MFGGGIPRVFVFFSLAIAQLSILTVLPARACNRRPRASTFWTRQRGTWQEEEEEERGGQEMEDPDSPSSSTVSYLSLLRSVLLQYGGPVLLRESQRRDFFVSSSSSSSLLGGASRSAKAWLRKPKKELQPGVSLPHQKKTTETCRHYGVRSAGHTKTRRTLLQGLQCLASCLQPST